MTTFTLEDSCEVQHMGYFKWVQRDNGRWEKTLDLTSEEAHIGLLRMTHVDEQESAKSCDNCGVNPREHHDFDGFTDIYCTECINCNRV